MLRPIHRVSCSPALAACQRLLQHFALWLCNVNVHGVDITEGNLRNQMPSDIEGAWLWSLIAVDKRSSTRRKDLFTDAKAIADLPANEKAGLAEWVRAVANVAQHFSQASPAAPSVASPAAPPVALPDGPPNGWGARSTSWQAFQALMVVFYQEGLREGLPYRSNGVPTQELALRVTYEHFTHEFRQAHRPDPHPDAREICVLCGGELGQHDVDHWVGKSAFPLLSICADNLLPICGTCNEPPQKGQKPVHTNGQFVDWFHPYFRHANGTLRLRYDEAAGAIRVESTAPEHTQKVVNLDRLLNLGQRWTRELKAEYRRLQRKFDPTERAKQGRPALNAAELTSVLTEYRDDLTTAEPNYEVRRVLADALLDPARLRALLVP